MPKPAGCGRTVALGCLGSMPSLCATYTILCELFNHSKPHFCLQNSSNYSTISESSTPRKARTHSEYLVMLAIIIVLLKTTVRFRNLKSLQSWCFSASLVLKMCWIKGLEPFTASSSQLYCKDSLSTQFLALFI